MHVRSCILQSISTSHSVDEEMVRKTNESRVDMIFNNLKAAIMEKKNIEKSPLNLNMVCVACSY
jgi:hypothetical protein